MPLDPGTRLGPYEILSPIGKGGMGEVYLARDTRLDRTVAVKILPEHLASSPVRRARFEREARAISQLNHPNICTLHDVGEQDGVDYLVMEFIDGETLASRVRQGPLNFEEALGYAIQIAAGLDTAHRVGIVHRDLKPGNIMLTKSGVKLLDFGLAKSLEDKQGSEDSDAPTQERAFTKEQGLVGTLHYMSPEQLEGNVATARSDIFAFGAVLYEMLSGKKVFTGDSPASVIGAILNDELPSLPVSSVASSPEIDRLLQKCLAKDPDDRWASAQDLAEVLTWSRSRDARRHEHGGRLWQWLLVAGAVVLTLTLGAWIGRARLPADSANVTRFSLRTSDFERGPLEQSTSIAVSPDGRRVALVTIPQRPTPSDQAAGKPSLLVRDLDNLDVRPLQETEGAAAPFFSPDGEWIGYASDAKLMKIPARGGVPQLVLDIEASDFFFVGTQVRGASWGSDGFIYFNKQTQGLFRVPESGGEIELLLAPSPDEDVKTVRFPHVLPGERALLFTVGHASMDSYDQATISLLSLETGEVRALIEGGSNARYSPTGHILYGRGGHLMAVPFDVDRLEVTGRPRSVVSGIATSHVWGNAQFALSNTGTLVYAVGTPEDYFSKTAWVGRDGEADPFEVRRDLFEVEMSPGGTDVALWESKGNDDIWSFSVGRRTLTRITDRFDNIYPTWMPDGKNIIYLAMPPGGGIMRKAADGTGEPELLLATGQTIQPGNVSSDGRLLIYSDGDDIWVLPLLADGDAKRLIDGSGSQTQPRFAPDSGWVAYVSNESGREEVYVQPFEEAGGRTLVSIAGGRLPHWRGDGRELFFYGQDAMQSVKISTGKRFAASAPSVLFERPGIHDYDVTPDGSRFLVIERDVASFPSEINIVLNWFEVLNELMSASR